MVFILSISILQQDMPARLLSNMMALNIIVTQGLKRLYHRPRPIDFHPTAPRARKIIETDKQSGFASNMIILGTTFTFATFAINSWAKHFLVLNDVEQWTAGLIGLSVYFILSFLKVHLGQNYPSDCVISAIPILIIVGLWYLVNWLQKLSTLCPTCKDLNTGSDNFCYFESPEIAGKAELMTRESFQVGYSNSLSSAMISLGTFLVFSVLSSYPIDFWKKTSYFVPTLLAIYLFDNILLCPTSENNYRTINMPTELTDTAITAS